MKGRVLLGILFAVAALIAIPLILSARNGSDPRFKTERVSRGDIRTTVTASGTVNPVVTVSVGTQVSGTINRIFVDYNTPVVTGTLLARIDPAPFIAQVDQARANLLVAESNVQKAEAKLLDAERTEKRSRELLSRDLIARSEQDTAQVNLELAKAEVSGSRAQLSQATAAQRLAETNLACTRILSPIDGVVISKSVDVGQTVAASFQTPTLFKIAQDLTRMQIDTNVDEADIGSVAVGQEVEFTVDAYPEVDFRGSVRQVRNDPVTVQNVVTYDAVIDVDNPELKLKPGMTANVSIITTEKTDVLRVANAALRYRPAETGDGARDPSRQKGYGVWVLEEGAPKHVPLSLGVSDGVYTEVVAGDLSEGEELIVSTVEKPASGRRKPALRLF